MYLYANTRGFIEPGLNHDNFTGRGWFPLIGLLVFSLIAIVAIWVVYHVSLKWINTHGQPSNNAINIAKERYAKGEISHEEYQKLVKNLEK